MGCGHRRSGYRWPCGSRTSGKTGLKVIVLEARKRVGGRILTLPGLAPKHTKRRQLPRGTRLLGGERPRRNRKKGARTQRLLLRSSFDFGLATLYPARTPANRRRVPVPCGPAATLRKRRGSGDSPGLQNRRLASLTSMVRSTRTRFRQNKRLSRACAPSALRSRPKKRVCCAPWTFRPSPRRRRRSWSCGYRHDALISARRRSTCPQRRAMNDRCGASYEC